MMAGSVRLVCDNPECRATHDIMVKVDDNGQYNYDSIKTVIVENGWSIVAGEGQDAHLCPQCSKRVYDTIKGDNTEESNAGHQ